MAEEYHLEKTPRGLDWIMGYRIINKPILPLKPLDYEEKDPQRLVIKEAAEKILGEIEKAERKRNKALYRWLVPIDGKTIKYLKGVELLARRKIEADDAIKRAS